MDNNMSNCENKDRQINILKERLEEERKEHREIYHKIKNYEQYIVTEVYYKTQWSIFTRSINYIHI